MTDEQKAEISTHIECARMALNSADSYRRDGWAKQLYREVRSARNRLSALMAELEATP